MKTIEINNLSMSFPKKGSEAFYALKDLTLDVHEGEVFCLLGPNGSGKTTTINMINGLNRPTGGNVLLKGIDPSREKQKTRQMISVVPQETALYNDLSARENLSFHAAYYGVERRFRRGRIDNAIDLVGLAERQHDRVGTFSGGMQRRLALARALLTEPDILLLDEPTLGVDVQSRNLIWSKISDLAKQGKTIFLTTNYMEEADTLADRIVVIDRGQVVVSGTPKELKQRIHDNMVEIYFDNAEKAKKGFNYLDDKPNRKLVGERVQVGFEEKNEIIPLFKRLETLSENILSFEMREPTLNDVFLHFTGRKLRD